MLSVVIPRRDEFENTKPYAISVVVDATSATQSRRSLHKHATGFLGMPVDGGRYGTELLTGFWVIPQGAAAWVPPGVAHNAVQSAGARSISMHFAPEVSALLPPEPMRIILNPMTIEMVKHFTFAYGTTEACVTARRIASLIAEQIRSAPRIPESFAPVPAGPFMERAAVEAAVPETFALSNEAFAERLAVSERNLSRIIRNETGLTLGQWRLHIRMTDALSSLCNGGSVDAAACRCGYASTSSFIRAFRALFGRTPGQYAQQLGAGGPPSAAPGSQH